MERCSVVPNRDIVECPLVSDLKVMVLGDVSEEVGKDVIGFFGMQLNDTLGESKKSRTWFSHKI